MNCSRKLCWHTSLQGWKIWRWMLPSLHPYSYRWERFQDHKDLQGHHQFEMSQESQKHHQTYRGGVLFLRRLIEKTRVGGKVSRFEVRAAPRGRGN
ncbi:hypothetical protein ATANTOWER_028714 [Ataeniobius toweri]|uniref:Uncharacterized protein n=1 Tax=Ataeniobius toweri TaxID=208326 RepID=A0ABU7AWL5_9TELE|nr:hypothetical protein [Ataeniobius toweri]